MAIGALLCLLPQVAAWMGLLGGILLALTVGNPWPAFTRRWTPVLLQLSVVALSAGMNLLTVVAVGLHGLGYTAAGIALAFAAGSGLALLLAVPADLGLLITVGTAICGGSAIAAVAPVIRAREEDVSVSLATVFLL